MLEEDHAKEREKRKSTPAPHEANGTGDGNAISPFGDPPNEPDKVEDRSDEEDEEDEDGASDGEDHEDNFDITDSSPEGAAAAAERDKSRATSSGEISPPESSRSSSVDSSTTSTGAGADTGASAGTRIADLECEWRQHQDNMPIGTDGPAYGEALATAKAIKGRREDTMRTPRAQTHQWFSTPPPLPQVPHTHPPPHPNPHPHPYQHHPHITYTHGVPTPSGLRNEFTPPSRPARTCDTTHHHAVLTSIRGPIGVRLRSGVRTRAVTIIVHDDPTYRRRTRTPMRCFKGGKERIGKDWKDRGAKVVMKYFWRGYTDYDLPYHDDDDELVFPLVFCCSDRAPLVL